VNTVTAAPPSQPSMTCEHIEITYNVVTPLFCGGAGGDTAEVRVPSIKGVLRWWWRALAWPRYPGTEAERLRAIHRDEAALFGSAEGGKSKVILRLLPSAATACVAKGEVLTTAGGRVGDGARYLGYGVMEAFDNAKKQIKAGQLTRPCLAAPLEIKLALRVHHLEPSQRAALLGAVQAMGLLGGLGAKSRKGYGSLVLKEVSIDGNAIWVAPISIDVLHAEIARLLPGTEPQSPLAPYTALSPTTRVVLVPGRDRQLPIELLDLIGREMMRYRSWGHHGKVLTFEREENFKDDHDLMKQDAPQRSNHPRRIVFGLPHNYGRDPKDQVGPGDNKVTDRRASPLLIHVHVCGTTPVAVLSFLPARFLPKGDQATIRVGGPRVRIAGDPTLWQPIHGFLARFLDPPHRERFRGAREVQR
jgi:CRISPR-associated protein Cmr1